MNRWLHLITQSLVPCCSINNISSTWDPAWVVELDCPWWANANIILQLRGNIANVRIQWSRDNTFHWFSSVFILSAFFSSSFKCHYFCLDLLNIISMCGNRGAHWQWKHSVYPTSNPTSFAPGWLAPESLVVASITSPLCVAFMLRK